MNKSNDVNNVQALSPGHFVLIFGNCMEQWFPISRLMAPYGR